jgi:hypothetical protein
VPFSIKDEANVDQRRESIGLEPLEDYLEFLKEQYFQAFRGQKGVMKKSTELVTLSIPASHITQGGV